METRTKWLIGGLAAAVLLYLFSRTRTGQSAVQSAISTGANIVNSISQAGLDMIAKFEGFARYKYNDPPGSVHYSIGYGHQILPGENFAEPIDHATALQLLSQDTGKAQAVVRQAVTAPLTQAQFDALTSLVYNIGAGNFAKSGIAKALNAGDIAGAVKLMKAHNKAHINGVLQIVPALTARRDQEASAFA